MCRTQVSGYEIAAGCFRAHPRRTSTRCILAGDRRGSKTSPDVGRICASRSHAICQSGESSQGSFTSYDLNRTDLNKLSPQGRRDDMPPRAGGSSTRGGSTSVRGRVRSLHVSGGRPAAGSQRADSLGWERQTDGSRYRLSPPPSLRRRHNKST